MSRGTRKTQGGHNRGWRQSLLQARRFSQEAHSRGGGVIGRTVSHYRILERLGGGGMGIVYRAQDTRLDRTVALKFLPMEWCQEALLRERFTREARAASTLDHPHICTVFDIDETPEGQLFIAMAYCPGETLKERILRGPMPIDEAIDIAIQIGEALGAAHEGGTVHRDIKPANILITDRDQVKVVDFGLAKLAGEATVTRQGSVIGTPAYMSPEQATGEEADGRSDLWALGTVLYEMVTGRRAFAADHEQAILLAITTSDPTPIEQSATGSSGGGATDHSALPQTQTAGTLPAGRRTGGRSQAFSWRPDTRRHRDPDPAIRGPGPPALDLQTSRAAAGGGACRGRPRGHPLSNSQPAADAPPPGPSFQLSGDGYRYRPPLHRPPRHHHREADRGATIRIVPFRGASQ